MLIIVSLQVPTLVIIPLLTSLNSSTGFTQVRFYHVPSHESQSDPFILLLRNTLDNAFGILNSSWLMCSLIFKLSIQTSSPIEFMEIERIDASFFILGPLFSIYAIGKQCIVYIGSVYKFANFWVVDFAFVDRADIKAYVGPPTLQARYEILRSCLQELMRTGIVSNFEV